MHGQIECLFFKKSCWKPENERNFGRKIEAIAIPVFLTVKISPLLPLSRDHLGHRSPNSTGIYVKVNLEALRLVAFEHLGGLV